jgi:hypothetical protein
MTGHQQRNRSAQASHKTSPGPISPARDKYHAASPGAGEETRPLPSGTAQ